MMTSPKPQAWLLLGLLLWVDVVLLARSPSPISVTPSPLRLCALPVERPGHGIVCLDPTEARQLAVTAGFVVPLSEEGVRLVGPPQRMSGEQQLALGLRLDPNQASVEELVALPDIGPALAQAIVAERQRSPFSDVAELLRVRGLGPKRLAKLRPFLDLAQTK